MVIRDAIIILCLIFIGTFVFVSMFRSRWRSKTPGKCNRRLKHTAWRHRIYHQRAFNKGKRFTHMLKVAFGVWLIGSMNVVFLQTTVAQWLSSIFFILIIMAIGGGISYLLAKPVKTG